MTKPSILVVDDDLPVLRAIERDLRARYAADYRILAVGTGAEAVETVRDLTLRGDAVALFLVDQRMPGVTGIELLGQTLELQPDAKRVLLTAYADTDVAISAINRIGLDHYILKPWDPPDQLLYPILDDLLDDWLAHFRPRFEGLRLLAQRWSPRGHAVRDFLTRNQVPYTWPDPSGAEAQRLLASLAAADSDGGGTIPEAGVALLLPDGKVLRDPSTHEIAEAIGLATEAALPFYDLVIVGAGPAGLAAAVYGASEGLKTLVIEREAPGGQAGTTSRIENYLGFPSGLSGGDLARRALTQARRLGAEILTPQEVVGLRKEGTYRKLTLGGGDEIACQACVIATGVAYRTLEVPGAEQLAGAGLYYGASASEALLCRDSEVGVVGGGNSAGQAAVHLSQYAHTVHLFARRGSLEETMSQYLVDEIAATPNVDVHLGATVTSVSGSGHLERATFEASSGTQELPVAALFIFIGQSPRTDWLGGVLARDDEGFLLTGHDAATAAKPPTPWRLEREPLFLETSLPGVFGVGDVRHGSVKRIASAVGEGAMAVQLVHRYIASL